MEQKAQFAELKKLKGKNKFILARFCFDRHKDTNVFLTRNAHSSLVHQHRTSLKGSSRKQDVSCFVSPPTWKVCSCYSCNNTDMLTSLYREERKAGTDK